LCAIGLIAGLGIGHKVRVQHVTSRVRERLEERTAERVRLARDLHDTLLQGVQGLMLRFHFAAEQIPEREPARAMMEAALKAADRVIEEGRDHVRGLRSEGLNERDLPNALAQVGADLNWNQSVRFSVSVEGANLTLHPIVEDELYFIGREAIANAFRHANASQIQVEINADRKTICIRCRDNGMGMSPDILRGGGKDGHWGIRGMRERAERIGAKLDCWSTTGRGTEVVVTVSAKAVFASQRAHKTA
jgi:signal transduction histidine kinase